MMFFAQSFGGAVFVAIGQAIFDNHLSTHLGQVPGLDVGNVIHSGATELRKSVPADKLAQVALIYNEALRKEFIVATAASSCMILAVAAMEWRKIEVAPHGAPKVKESSENAAEKSTKEEA